jgi:flagellar biosynthesis chaperone FliJ
MNRRASSESFNHKGVRIMTMKMGLVLCAALLTVASAGAQQNPSTGLPPGNTAQRGSDALKTVLDLTDRQVTELNDLVTAHNQKLQQIGTQIRDLDKQRRDAQSSGNTALATALAAQIQTLQQQAQDESTAFHDNALRVLDSAQRDKVKQIEDALKLAPSAGPLMQFGLLDTSQLPGGARGGFLGGMGAVMMRGGGGGGGRGPGGPGGAGAPPQQ